MISYNSLVDLNIFAQIIDNLGDFLSEYNLEIDSRKVTTASIFCAYPGYNTDGRKFIVEAINKGAKAVIYEAGTVLELPVKSLAVKNLGSYIGLLAAYKYANPSTKYYTFGVTGTNGKTSVSHWINQIYSLLHNKTAIIGTTGAGIYGEITDYAATTPDPITLQKILADFAQAKVDIMAMEVSSHALHQGRVNGIDFKSAIFTNLTQDHLDYHKTMEVYYTAKRELFYWSSLEYAIINKDDSFGQRLIAELSADKIKHNYPLNIISYGVNSGDLQACNIMVTLAGMRFNLRYQGNEYSVQVKVIGLFNVYNILAVIGATLAKGYSLDKVIPLLRHLEPVKGRMDTIIEPGMPLIVVDFAHTPDALLNTLKTLSEVEHRGKLYCVFGCGGDRDNTKRPLMGNVATKMADFSFITSDNPRFEGPESIINQIVAGVANQNYKVIVDRKQAIIEAINNAQAGDIVVIAGKGHETYQDIQGKKTPFSDFEIARQALANLHYQTTVN